MTSFKPIAGTRLAKDGETCECGDGARMVFETQTRGDVPWCGGHDQPVETPSAASTFTDDLIALVDRVTAPDVDQLDQGTLEAMLAEIDRQCAAIERIERAIRTVLTRGQEHQGDD